jgi:hypothetical protein
VSCWLGKHYCKAAFLRQVLPLYAVSDSAPALCRQQVCCLLACRMRCLLGACVWSCGFSCLLSVHTCWAGLCRIPRHVVYSLSAGLCCSHSQLFDRAVRLVYGAALDCTSSCYLLLPVAGCARTSHEWGSMVERLAPWRVLCFYS